MSETHLGQVHRHIQVVIQEIGILLRVQQLQEGRGGVTLVTTANLIHLERERRSQTYSHYNDT